MDLHSVETCDFSRTTEYVRKREKNVWGKICSLEKRVVAELCKLADGIREVVASTAGFRM